MRLIAALLAALTLPVVAACGGGEGPGGAAEAVPADVAFYVVADTDVESDQWEAVQELAASFPGGEDLTGRIVEELEAEGELDFEEDVEPALGPVVAFAVLGLEQDTEGSEPFVLLTQPEDAAAFARLVEREPEPGVVREIDDWQVAAMSEDVLDRFEAALDGGRLADSDGFQDAMDGLDEDGLVTFYGNLARVEGAAEGAASAQLDTFFPGGEAPVLGGTVRAEDDGARLDGRLVYAEEVEGSPFSVDPYEAELPGVVPGDVLAYVSFNDLEQAISAYRDALAEGEPELESQLGMVEGLFGLSLEEDIAPLFAGEGAVYARHGALIPEVTLVTRIEDEAAALETLDGLVARLGIYFPFARPERTEVDGVEVREIALSAPFKLSYAAFDGLLVVTTSSEGIADLREDEDRLADADAFEEALDRAGAPDETSGFAYVDLEEALPLLFGLAEAGNEETEEARRYTDPLTSLVAWGEQDGDTQRFSLFVGIE
ncbi:MAG: DUF3352 domain-containing protein [Gaiellaceae bacterium]